MFAKKFSVISLFAVSLTFAAHKDAGSIPKLSAAPKVETKKIVPVSGRITQNIAVVDVQKIILDTQVDKEFVKDLIDLQQNLQKDLKQLGEEIQNEEKGIKAKAATLSPEALKKKQEELEDKNQKAQLKLQRSNKDLQEAEMKTRMQVFKKVQDHAQEFLARNKDIVAVFEKSGGMLAYSPSIDKTSELSAIVKADVAKKEAAAKPKAAPKAEINTKK